MKAVILAAGKGTRMGALSEVTPKPMLPVAGKPILFHILDAMPQEVNEILITVNHLKEKIISALGNVYKGKKITYVENKKLQGTADALWDCRDKLQNEEKFLVLMGDNLYAKKDLDELPKNPWAMLVKKKDSIKGVAKVVIDEEENIMDVVERYSKDEPGYMNAGAYALTPDVFKYEMVEWGSGEYGLPQTIMQARNDRIIKAVPSTFVFIITTPEDLVKAEEYLK